MNSKKLDKFELIKKIKKHIDLLKVKKEIFELVIPVLKTFEGKQVSKRIENKLKEQLPQLTISYYQSYTYIELKVWGNGLKYDDRINFNLCKNDSDKIFKMENVLQYDNWYDYQGHIDKLNEFKKNINDYVKNWNEFIDYLDLKEKEFKDIPYPISEHFYMRHLFY